MLPDEYIGQPIKRAQMPQDDKQANGGGKADAAGANGSAADTPPLLRQLSRPGADAQRRPLNGRRESTWLKEEQRCRNPAALIQFFQLYSQLVRRLPLHCLSC